MAELECREVGVRFGGLQALQDVQLTVPTARVSGLIGPNGAGKTTLFNVITGLQPPSSGRVFFDGRDISKVRPSRRSRLGIARTFQRLELFGSLTARENVLMAAETARTKLGADESPLMASDRLLEQVGLAHVAEEPADALPTGLSRLVELARALATSPKILLLDEPSAGLNHAETEALGRVLTQLADQGMGVLLVEHDMGLVMGVCGQVTVLEFGEVIASGEPAAVKSDPAVQAAYLGAEEATRPDPGGAGGAGEAAEDGGPSDAPPEALPPLVTTPPGALFAKKTPAERGVPAAARHRQGAEGGDGKGDQDPLLSVVDIRAAYGRIEVVHGVSLDIPRGSVTALLGPNGAGKSTLLKVISGIIPPTSGEVRYDGKVIRRTSPERLARQGLCTIPEGRAVFPNLTVAENLRMFTYRGRSVTMNDLEEKSYERFPVLGRRRRQLAGRMSGGEQQMLALARALFTDPQFLLLDEISMGLAPLIVVQLYEAVGQLVEREELTVLLVEQFVTTALSVADQACVMVTGEIVDRGVPSEVSERLAGAYLGEVG